MYINNIYFYFWVTLIFKYIYSQKGIFTFNIRYFNTSTQAVFLWLTFVKSFLNTFIFAQVWLIFTTLNKTQSNISRNSMNILCTIWNILKTIKVFSSHLWNYLSLQSEMEADFTWLAKTSFKQRILKSLYTEPGQQSADFVMCHEVSSCDSLCKQISENVFDD